MLLASALWNQNLTGGGKAQYPLSDLIVPIGHWSVHGMLLRKAGPLSTF